MYKVVLLPDAEISFRTLDKTIRSRIANKIDWLSKNADLVVHHPLKFLPDDLRSLCRVRVGDYRILYWLYEKDRIIKIYGIEHRSKKYRSLKKK
jgi:mRNA-degrading endonuclease RelE of RelBE toxin-antitoxin system